MKMLTGLLPPTEGTATLFGSSGRGRQHGGAQEPRLHDPGVLALRRADRPPEPGPARAPLSPAARQGQDAHRGAGGAVRAGRAPRRPGRGPAHGPAPAAVARGRRAARAADPDPRRADLRRRSGRARQLLGAADRPVAQAGRHHLRHHPLHERGHALRPHLADERGQGAGLRRAAEADRRSAARPAWRRRSSATWRTRSRDGRPAHDKAAGDGRGAPPPRPPAAAAPARARDAAVGHGGCASAGCSPTPATRPCRSCAIRSG